MAQRGTKDTKTDIFKQERAEDAEKRPDPPWRICSQSPSRFDLCDLCYLLLKASVFHEKDCQERLKPGSLLRSNYLKLKRLCVSSLFLRTIGASMELNPRENCSGTISMPRK